MAVPSYDVWMRPTLEYLADGRERTVKEINEQVARHFKLTPEEMAELLPSGSALVYKSRGNWARVYLLKAGLIERVRRAVFKITAEGQRLLADPAVTVIDNQVLCRYPSFVDFYKNKNSSAQPADESVPQTSVEQKLKTQTDEQEAEPGHASSPDEDFENALSKINNLLIDDLKAEMMQIDEYRFESFVLDLLKAVGYGISGEIHGTPKSRDGGIDGVIFDDKLGFNKIFVQIKKYALEHAVGRQELQSFVGAISGLDGKGLFVTTSDFSSGAREYAAKQNLVLLNGTDLAKLMIEHNFGVTIRKTFYVKSLDSDLFAEYTEKD